jgi:hypothetical protein
MALTPAVRPVMLAAILAAMPAAGSADPQGDYLDRALDEIEPSITIREHKNRVEQEYRVNNNLYMVKVTPSAGPSYYLVDPDGQGDMELRRNSLGMDVRPPQWALFRW